MAQNPNNLPYFKCGPTAEEKALANFLLRKFRPKIRRKFPQHYLIQPIPYKTLRFIKESAKKYPYFLRFDIKLYYPSILPQDLLEKLPNIYQKILEKPPSRRFKNYLKNEIPKFLANSPYGKGVPIGSRLSFVLAGICLLDLDWEIPYPFLRQNDDYLIFCKSREAEKLLRDIILPKLKELNLEINVKKLKSGKLWQEKVNFIGFEFYSGYIRIAEDKIEEFKQRIKKLTYLTRKKPVNAAIKQLNNQILGFGHYYKFAQAKQVFEELDGFIRSRLRRYINRNKDSRAKQTNLVLTNTVLKTMGLKSLVDIYCKYASKKRHKFKKKAKIRQKTGRFKKSRRMARLEEIYPVRGLSSNGVEFKYQLKLILNQLKQLTNLAKKLERRIANLEQNLAK